MVTITNGEKSFRVTAGAVKIYKNMGFHIVTNEELELDEKMEDAGRKIREYNNNMDGSVEANTFDGSGEEEFEGKQSYDSENEDGISKDNTVFVEELLEKPLSQWTNEEVKEFVKIKGIDTSGAQKVSQVRSIIKTYLEEEQKNNV